MNKIIFFLVAIYGVCLAGQPTISPSGQAREIIDIEINPTEISGPARLVIEGYMGDSSNVARAIWPPPDPVTVSNPQYTGGGTINAGASGSIAFYGSVASDGTAVTYEITNYSNITSISPTTNLSHNQTVNFTVANLSSSGTWAIYVRAKSASGAYGNIITISGTITGNTPTPGSIIVNMTVYEHITSIPGHIMFSRATSKYTGIGILSASNISPNFGTRIYTIKKDDVVDITTTRGDGYNWYFRLSINFVEVLTFNYTSSEYSHSFIMRWQ